MEDGLSPSGLVIAAIMSAKFCGRGEAVKLDMVDGAGVSGEQGKREEGERNRCSSH